VFKENGSLDVVVVWRERGRRSFLGYPISILLISGGREQVTRVVLVLTCTLGEVLDSEGE
jgi:hypothetical protein